MMIIMSVSHCDAIITAAGTQIDMNIDKSASK